MTESLPIVLIPGLNCSARLYLPQLAALWRLGPVMVADHTRDDSISAIARRILTAAPPRFALAGLSMGGYIAFEIMRQAADRVARLALLDTSARADLPDASQKRHANIAAAQEGRFEEIIAAQFPLYVHPARADDAALKSEYLAMCHDVGPQAYIRQQNAILRRVDSRPSLAGIRCATMVLVGEQDEATPLALSQEIASAISCARLVTVPDCGHLATLERPQAVADALVAWMTA
ncbi:MAG: alpha/beta fold hydrolase [Alphaproteobacteria bacterium]|nr:alpha/beta fold hydrolase [Alphaproteobacteria bacterium]